MSQLDNERELREELATGTRILGRHEMVGLFGHVSLLTEDPSQYLISPGAGLRKDRCRPEDLKLLHLDENFEIGRPLELYMHAEMHRARPDVRSLIHVHSPALTALAAMTEVPGDLLMMHASFWPEKVPVWDRPELVTTHEMGAELVEIIGDESIALLRWHGAVIVGKTLREAVMRTLLAEQHASQLLTALSHGQPLTPLPHDCDRHKLYEKVVSPPTHDMNWHFEASYVTLAPGAGVR